MHEIAWYDPEKMILVHIRAVEADGIGKVTSKPPKSMLAKSTFIQLKLNSLQTTKRQWKPKGRSVPKAFPII